MTASALAEAASGLVGSRFRLHGRDPATGLDCVGVLAAALTATGREHDLPGCYSLRTREPADLADLARGCGLVPAALPIAPGDVVFVRIGACQFHLMVALGEERYVHAHAGLRRVALHIGRLFWPIIGHWRQTEPN